MRRLAATLLAAALAWPAAAQPPKAPPTPTWSTVGKPSSGPPRVVGKTAQGCIGGAVGLPLEGPGYQVLRPASRRYFGHPDAIRFVEMLGRWSVLGGHGLLLIGDMAQPRGGPMASSHASHQSGLDIDIWFRRTPRPLGAAEIAQPIALDMLRPDGKSADPARFGAAEVDLLRLVATRPEVERILVNPALKRAACAQATGDRSWLRRLRPWWGHNMHFHVRLACPAGQVDCEPGPAIPPGDGCGPDLDWWLSDEAAEALLQRLKPREPAPPKKLPPACMDILKAR